ECARSRRRGEHERPDAQRCRRRGGAVPRGDRSVADADGKFLMRRSALQLIAVLVLFAGCGGKKEEEVAPVVTVDVAPVLLSNIQRTIRVDGLLYPKQPAAIVPKITAPVKRTYVQRGAHVHAGQLLLELENQDLAAAATESRAALAQAEATFETTTKATVPEELQKAELDAKAAEDAVAAQQALFDNRQRLYREGAIAQKEVN